MDKGSYLFDMDGVLVDSCHHHVLAWLELAKKFEGQLNEAYRVQNYDYVAVAESYHPLCCAPGYSMYFLA